MEVRIRCLLALVASLLLLIGSNTAAADMRLAPVSHIGWQADVTTGADICLLASHDTCRTTAHTGTAGGFDYPDSVAADPRTGHVYVTEINGNRVQELTSSGAFVSMFGWGVNASNDRRPGASLAEKDLCEVTSADVCRSGDAGSGAGELDSPESVAVDPVTGDIYVSDIATGDFHVDKFSHSGQFAWRVGRSVNQSTGGNLCTAREIERKSVHCGPGMEGRNDDTQPGAFKFANQSGDLLAVDGRRQRLYVGDERRVQAFGTDGRWLEDISLSSLSAAPQSSVVALALDRAGALYVVYRVGPVETLLPSEHANLVHKFNVHGEEVAQFPLRPVSPSAVISINGLAINRAGRMAVMGVEVGDGASGRFGRLYDTRGGESIGSFPAPGDNEGIAMGEGDRLYVATAVGNEVVIYGSVPPAGELRAAPSCEAFAVGESSCP